MDAVILSRAVWQGYIVPRKIFIEIYLKFYLKKNLTGSAFYFSVFVKNWSDKHTSLCCKSFIEFSDSSKCSLFPCKFRTKFLILSSLTSFFLLLLKMYEYVQSCSYLILALSTSFHLLSDRKWTFHQKYLYGTYDKVWSD